MLNRISAVVALFALCAAAQDSIVSTEQDYVWSTYPTEAPVTAFCFKGSDLWIAAGGQVTEVNMKRGTLSPYTKIGSMPTAGISTMATDCTGGFWFGGVDGVAMKKGSKTQVFTTEDGLPDNAISIVRPARSKVWVGTPKGAAAYQSGKWKVYTAKDGLVGDNVTAIIIDMKDRAWLGTDKGISMFDGAAWKSHTMQNGLSWNETLALGVDRRNGRIWAAVGEGDVNRWDGKEWKVFMSIQEGINSIMADTQGRVWFGSDSGLLKYNGMEWVTDPDKLGVSAASVSQLAIDDAGNMYFGTARGVMRLANPYPF
ncbi:MAG: hypothetical protein GF398_09015 [Chitinivibrionales bacterium]|nr:hypothetical protein [Chitinivibrionales bacterium]